MDYFAELQKLISRMCEEPPAGLDRLVESIFQCWEQSGKVVSFGNGGSASDSLHFTTELVARMKDEPIQRPAISLNASPSNMTAIANDWSYDQVFSKQVEALCNREDLLLGISTSGNSENVCRALTTGTSMGTTNFGLTGQSGGKFSSMNVELIRVPSKETSHIQEAHIACLHYVCSEIDRTLNRS